MNIRQQIWEQVKDLEGWCDEARCHKIVDLILEHEPELIVELGVFGGRSLAAMGLAVRYVGCGNVWGIDPWTNQANLEGEPNEHLEYWLKLDIEAVYRNFVENMRRMGLDKECRWLRTRGEDVVDGVRDGSIDLFYLDSNHSELSSTRDVGLWLPKIAKGGRIMLDDTGWKSMGKAVEMVKNSGFEMTHDGVDWAVFTRLN